MCIFSHLLQRHQLGQGAMLSGNILETVLYKHTKFGEVLSISVSLAVIFAKVAAKPPAKTVGIDDTWTHLETVEKQHVRIFLLVGGDLISLIHLKTRGKLVQRNLCLEYSHRPQRYEIGERSETHLQ